jgi:hypothetical protein
VRYGIPFVCGECKDHGFHEIEGMLARLRGQGLYDISKEASREHSSARRHFGESSSCSVLFSALIMDASIVET